MTENQKDNIQNRDAKGKVLEMLFNIPAAFQLELIARYQRADDLNPVVGNRHKIIVGTWFNRAVKAMLRGATYEELNKLVQVCFVAIHAEKFNLDIGQAIEDADLENIMKKYINPKMLTSEERMYKDRQLQIKHAAQKRNVVKMHSEGKSNTEIAEALELPESTVRFFLRNTPEADQE